MTEIQQHLLDLLLELDAICRKHQIIYYLVGGSALGAVRHKGFLPWDDDADIVITKDNWEKLKRVFETDMPKDRVCANWENSAQEPSVFFRYVDTTKTFILYSLFNKKMPWGAIIDLFVLNPLPADRSKWDAYHRDMRRFGEYVMDANIVANRDSNIAAYLWDRLRGKVLGYETVKKKLYHKLDRYREEDCTHFSYLYARIHLIYEKEIFAQPRYVPFEGHMLPIPTLAEEHLRVLYGDDWFVIPPQEGKITHVAVHDMTRPYQEYFDDYMPYIDQNRLMKAMRRVKLKKMTRWKFYNAHERRVALRKAQYLAETITVHWEKKKELWSTMASQCRFETLAEELKPYWSEQLQEPMLHAKVVIAMPEAFLKLILKTMISCGLNRKASKIIELYEFKTKKIPAFIPTFVKLLDEKKKMFIAFETNRPEALKIAQNLFERYPEDKDIRFVCLSLLLKTVSNIEMLAEASQMACDGRKFWPSSLEFVKLDADVKTLQGHVEESVPLYKEVRVNSRNGMLLLSIPMETD